MRYSSTLLNPCILGVTLNLDLSMSLFCITLMRGHKCLVRISDRYGYDTLLCINGCACGNRSFHSLVVSQPQIESVSGCHTYTPSPVYRVGSDITLGEHGSRFFGAKFFQPKSTYFTHHLNGTFNRSRLSEP